ncbi:MAG: hypothetical protein EOP49_52320 [Sphingobacteriales bacterium]|nr:MAG: hypothetical protein EOP49_52320 [Sphingobacteriales bacterium]
MVHEFQADKAAGADTAVYGSFLIEQSVLRSAPLLTHSFNYSPIKNRIAMLTGKRSARARMLKYLAVMPLSVALILCCTKTSFSEQGGDLNAETVAFKGSVVTFEAVKLLPWSFYQKLQQQQKDLFVYSSLPDSVLDRDPVSHEFKMHLVQKDRVPVSINGEPVYGNEDVNAYPFLSNNLPKYAGAQFTIPYDRTTLQSLDQYLFAKLEKDLSKLGDGAYYLGLDKVIINDEGQVAYYEFKGLHTPTNHQIREDLRNNIDGKLKAILDGPLQLLPAEMEGRKVHVRYRANGYRFHVKDHKAVLEVGNGGC